MVNSEPREMPGVADDVKRRCLQVEASPFSLWRMLECEHFTLMERW